MAHQEVRRRHDDKQGDAELDEITRVRMFYQRKLEELAKKCEGRVLSAQKNTSEKSRASSLGEVETLRAENQVLRVRLQELFPAEIWLDNKISDQVEAGRRVAEIERLKISNSQLNAKVKTLTRENADLLKKLAGEVKAHKSVEEPQAKASEKLSSRLHSIEERIIARKRELSEILEHEETDLLQVIKTERNIFISKLSEKNQEIADLKSKLERLADA